MKSFIFDKIRKISTASKLSRRHQSIFMSALLLIAAPSFLNIAGADAPAALSPEYLAQACCSLCPRASNPDAYSTPFLQRYSLLVEGKDGWLFRSNIDLVTSLVPEDEKIYDDFSRIAAALKARGTQVIMVPIPPRGLIEVNHLRAADRAHYDYNSALKGYGDQLQRLRDAGFIEPDFTLLANEPDGANFFFRHDSHWSPSGTRRTAKLIADTIQSLKLDTGFTKKKYETNVVGVGRRDGQMPVVAAAICGGQYPMELYPKYETIATASDDLFGGDAVPDVALVGSSMSGTPEYHFAGFLQELLQTDVLNVAFSGGDVDGSITQYLMSDVYQKHPPKLIIWEVPYQDVVHARHEMMRRLVPLTSNGCAGRTPLLAGAAPLKSGQTPVDVLYNGGSQIISAKSRDLVIDMQFDDPNIKNISTEIWYLGGGHEVVGERYNDFTNTRGRFVIELSHEPQFANQSPVDVRVQVITEIEKTTTVKATLCSVSS